MKEKFDFSGWATRNDLRCSDGRTIRKDAFKDNDGQTVPLVWQHRHDDPTNVLGHALLENRDEGVYAYCTFNDTEWGQHVKSLVEHGDVTSLSIYANQLKQHGSDVLHGAIKEVSLVLAGANPGAFIDVPVIEHSDGHIEEIDEATIFTDEEISLYHEDTNIEASAEEEVVIHEDKKDDEESVEVEEEKKEEDKKVDKEKTVADVLETLNEEQKIAVGAVIQKLMEDKADNKDDEDDADEKKEVKHSDDEGDNVMKHNVFDAQTASDAAYLSHSDEESIIAAAKKGGSFKQAFVDFAEANELAHADGDPKAVSGFNSYPVTRGEGVEALFPDFRDVRPGAPEIVTDDNAWVKAVLSKVHKSPYSRIRTRHTDIRRIEALRAKGYLKGREKKLAGQYNVAIRTTEPQTVYVKSALNRDDIVDITDFDYVAYQYGIDRMELEKELAQAILVGDGRDIADADKINPERIRPIWTDNDIFTIHEVLTVDTQANGTNTAANFGAGYLYADAMETLILKAKINYRGSGNMDMFTTQANFNKMQLAKDMNGRRIYANKNELMSALDVSNIYNVPEFEGLTRTVGNKTYKLIAILGNLNDYAMGATKGGEITHFTDFDIDFNQHKSLLETRCSGATTRLYSFIVIEEEVTAGGEDDGE